MSDTQRMILAIALSLAVFVGWTYGVEAPKQRRLEAERQAAQMLEADKAANLPDLGAPKALPGPEVAPGDAGLSAPAPAARRVPIETPKLKGSLNLLGARIDDLELTQYRETVAPKSSPIVLLKPKGQDQAYYAEFGWSGQAADLPGPETIWTLVEGETLKPGHNVVLRHKNPQGLVFTRTISVDEDYLFTLTDLVSNEGSGPSVLYPYGRIARYGTPLTADLYLLHEGLIGVLDGKLEEVKYKKVTEDKRIERKSTGGWLGFGDKYWLTALLPDQGEVLTGSFNHARAGSSDLYQADYLGAAREVQPGASVTLTNRLFAGAKEIHAIDGYETTLKVALFDRAIDWGWFYFLTKPIFKALDLLFRLTGNFGIAILILTVVVKALFFPLANRAYESTTKMKKVAPEMQALQDRYKDDRGKMQQEIMALYAREKVNPLSGCLPILLQIPVFFSLYKVLYVSIEMRHAPFFGWIQDLSAPDPLTPFNLFGLLPFALPGFLHLGVWPILMGVSMYLLQKLQPPPGDPIQQRMFAILPLVITFTLASVPSGLAIYWTWSNLLSLLQQTLIMRRMGVPIEFFKSAPAKT